MFSNFSKKVTTGSVRHQVRGGSVSFFTSILSLTVTRRCFQSVVVFATNLTLALYKLPTISNAVVDCQFD